MRSPALLTLRDGDNERYACDMQGRLIVFCDYTAAYKVAEAHGYNLGDKSKVAFADEMVRFDQFKATCGVPLVNFSKQLTLRI